MISAAGTFGQSRNVLPTWNFAISLAGRLTACEEYRHINCLDGSAEECNLAGVYAPRQWKNSLKEAKEYCRKHSDCRGITRDDNGYEPRRGLDVSYHANAYELWLCKGK